MADSGSLRNGGIAPPSSSSSAAVPPDWEVLTMSMSASALGKPHGDDSDNVSENLSPQIDGSSNPNLNDGAFASDVWTDPPHANVNRDTSNDAVAEPFTERWKPNISTSSSLYGYGAEPNLREEALLSSASADTYFDSSNASIGFPEGLLVLEKNDADAEKRVLAYGHSADDVKDVIVKEKINSKGRKWSKKSSKVVWSIAVAATVVGIFWLGHRLHTANHQNQQLQIQISAKDEKLNDLLLQVNRLKEVVGNRHRVHVSRN